MSNYVGSKVLSYNIFIWSLLHAHQENLKSLAYRTLILNRPHIARNAADQNFPLQFTQVHDDVHEGEEEIPDERVSYAIFQR